jgi:hypothetical protein
MSVQTGQVRMDRRFMTGRQALLLAIFLLNVAAMLALYFSPLRDHHVLPEGAAIVAATAFAAGFRRVYALLLPLLSASVLVAMALAGYEGAGYPNFAYVFLAASTVVAALAGLAAGTRR